MRSQRCARRKGPTRMIFPLSGIVIGALVGGLGARSRGGKTLDLLQWAAVLGIIGGMIGLFTLVFIERAALPS